MILEQQRRIDLGMLLLIFAMMLFALAIIPKLPKEPLTQTFTM